MSICSQHLKLHILLDPFVHTRPDLAITFALSRTLWDGWSQIPRHSESPLSENIRLLREHN